MELIVATKHDAVPKDADAGLLVDIDLSILGADPERFDEYERQVRFEYQWVADDAFRAARKPVGLAHTISKTVITTYGRDFAVASTLFHRPTAPGKVGRQMQTWVRFAQGWRVVAAHVSLIDDAD